MWIFYPRPSFFDAEHYKRFAPDLARDPFYCWLDRYHLLMQIPVALTALCHWGLVMGHLWGICPGCGVVA